MTRFFDQFDQVRQSTRQRLTSADSNALPADGSAGPRPFDIEPLEKWLYEAYMRHYKNNPELAQAFWLGVAEALTDHVHVTQKQQGMSLLAVVALIESLACTLSISVIPKKTFAQTTELLTKPLGMLFDGGIRPLRIHSALLELALLTGSLESQNQMESALWGEVKREIAKHPNELIDPLLAHGVAMCASAWSVMHRSRPADLSFLTTWYHPNEQETIQLQEHLRHAQALLQRMQRSCDERVWASVESGLTGRPSLQPSTSVPRFHRAVAPTIRLTPSLF